MYKYVIHGPQIRNIRHKYVKTDHMRHNVTNKSKIRYLQHSRSIKISKERKKHTLTSFLILRLCLVLFIRMQRLTNHKLLGRLFDAHHFEVVEGITLRTFDDGFSNLPLQLPGVFEFRPTRFSFFPFAVFIDGFTGIWIEQMETTIVLVYHVASIGKLDQEVVFLLLQERVNSCQNKTKHAIKYLHVTSFKQWKYLWKYSCSTWDSLSKSSSRRCRRSTCQSRYS